MILHDYPSTTYHQDQVMQKDADKGNVLGFSVLRVSAMKEKPLDVAL